MVETQTKKPQGIAVGKNRLLETFRAFFNSYIFYIFQTLAACWFVWLEQEVLGAVVFVGLLSLILIVCDDILPTTLPFLLLCTFTTNCYDSFDTFMAYAIYAPVPIVSFIYHFIVYKKPYRSGPSVNGICLAGLAILLGGFGQFPFMDYVKGAYYVLGLSVGMVGAYLLMKSQFAPYRPYDERTRFSVIMLMEGLLCVGMIAIGYWKYYHGGNPLPDIYPLGFSRNNISTMLMFAMPFPLYLGIKKKGFEIFTPILFAAICLTTSRGGLIFGAIEFVFCCAFWIFDVKKHLARLLRFSFCLVALTAVALSCGKIILDVIRDRLIAEDVVTNDARWRMIWEGFANFEKNPLVGTGILDNSIFYGEFRKAGTMAWYHMMIPQIIGSMGLVGVVGYLGQFFGRAKLVFTKMDFWSLCLGVSYLGILLMSQVNPGEFCPLPFELLTVLLFILQEKRVDYYKPLPVELIRR